MKKLILIIFIFGFMLSSYANVKQSNVDITQDQFNIIPKKIQKYSEIDLSVINENTLILLDIDNTILRPTSHLGSYEFFITMLREIIQKENLTEYQAKLKAFEHWLKAQKLITNKLIDEKIHDFIEQARKQKATVIGFTARKQDFANFTYDQLAKLNVYLDQLKGFKFEQQYENIIFPDAKWCERNLSPAICADPKEEKYFNSTALFDRGILYTHDLNKKGQVFKDFYQQYIKYLSQHHRALPNKIVFVDDQMHNLDSMLETVTELGLKFYGFHIVDDFKYSHEIAIQEGANHNIKYN